MHIASVEDDPIQAQLIQRTLENAGFAFTLFDSGKKCLAAIQAGKKFDLFLLDWELPDMTGIELLVWIRQHIHHKATVVFLTNKGEDEELLEAFKLGADDYLTKPFNPAILLARVKANLRHQTQGAIDTGNETIVGPYRFDYIHRKAYLHGEHIVLAPKEFELASMFFRNIGHLFSRDSISTAIWNREIPATSRTLDTHLSNIRQKLKIQPNNGVQIIASYAMGYRLELIDKS